MKRFCSFALWGALVFLFSCTHKETTPETASPRFPSALGKVVVPAVTRYDDFLGSPEWQKLPDDEIPLASVSMVEVDRPSRAFAPEFPNIFLQNERMVVCWKDCRGPQPLQLSEKDGMTTVGVNWNGGAKVRADSFTALRMTNVYVWVNRLFDHMATLGFAPKNRLIVYVDRLLPDLASGVPMENNAFFNDKDWSLSFIPVSNTFLSQKFMKMKLRPAAYDPSVIMHEATHSVFQQVIGPIVTQEVYGLHEAFADYFAMSVLNSPNLGVFFGSGVPLRQNLPVLKYKPGAEAHDLGNVVAAALVKIRRDAGPLAPQVDQLAFAMLGEYSRDPFLMATDCADIFAKILPRFSSVFPSALQTQMLARWNETELTALRLGTFVVPSTVPTSTTGYFTLQVNTKIEPALAAQWGLPPFSTSRISFLAEKPGPLEGFTWYYVSVENDRRATPVWLLYSKAQQDIVRAYDLRGTEIRSSKQPVFQTLRLAKRNLQNVLQWKQQTQVSQFLDLFAGTGPISYIMQLKDRKMQESVVKVNDADVPVRVHSARISPTLLGALGSYLAGNLDKSLSRIFGVMSGVTFVTVPSTRFPNLRTPELSPGERVLGFTSRTAAGLESTIIFTAFDPAAPIP